MNNTCGTCGGFVGAFMWSGQGAKICNCGNLVNRPVMETTSPSCHHCYCIKIAPSQGNIITITAPHKKCCNCGHQTQDLMFQSTGI